MKELKHLKDIFENYDTFVIDLWGVMHNGVVLNSKAIDAINQLKTIKTIKTTQKNCIKVTFSLDSKSSKILISSFYFKVIRSCGNNTGSLTRAGLHVTLTE